MSLATNLRSIYEHKYRYFLFFTLGLLVLSLVVLGVQKATTGSFLIKSTQLAGGIQLKIPVDSTFVLSDFETRLMTALPEADIGTTLATVEGRPVEVIVEASDVEPDELRNAITSNTNLDLSEVTTNYISPRIGSSFYNDMITAMIGAIICMALVVLIMFRNFVPSLFVMLAAVSSLVSTLAVVVLLEVKLTQAGLAAFLAILGYSIDTDILLTTRVLKRQEGGTITDRTLDAMRTGVTQSLTGIAAVVVGLLITNSDVIRQIMLILAIGLVFDMIYTWFQNATILRMYMESKQKKTGGSQ